MTDDARDLLVEIAPEPTRPIDLDAIVKGAYHRRRARRVRAAIATLIAVIVVAGSVAAVSSDDGGSRLAVRAGSPPSGIPTGWTEVTVDGKGISLAIPPGWVRAARGDVANEDVVLGTTDRPSPGAVTACVSSGDPVVGFVGTWVSLYEYPAGSTTLAVPGGSTLDGPVSARPPDFRSAAAADGTCRAAPGYRFEMFVFTDAGRTFLAHVAQLGGADVNTFTLGQEVLNTLHVEPLASAAPDTSTTQSSSAPLTSIATVPPGITPKDTGSNGGGFFNATTTDQQKIQQAFLGWLDGKTLDQAAPYVDDFASISDAEAQGFAQQAQNVAGYSGRVDWVVIADPTHADVVYTLLNDGETVYANLPGKAVKVDGTWKVTRDTACALLAMGGIRCPARTRPAP
jgi:hypothetical protein